MRKLILVFVVIGLFCSCLSCSGGDDVEGETEAEVLLSDDFSDSTSGWSEYDLGVEGTAAYDNGQLKLRNYTSDELSTGSWLMQSFSDFNLEVETKLISGSDDNWHTVGFRAQDEDNSYEFGISADGYYTLVKWVDGESTILKDVTYSDYINTGQGETNTMCVLCDGNVIKAYVNGHLLVSVTDNTYTSGYLSLACTCLGGGNLSQIVFDNLEIKSV